MLALYALANLLTILGIVWLICWGVWAKKRKEKNQINGDYPLLNLTGDDLTGLRNYTEAPSYAHKGVPVSVPEGLLKYRPLPTSEIDTDRPIHQGLLPNDRPRPNTNMPLLIGGLAAVAALLYLKNKR